MESKLPDNLELLPKIFSCKDYIAQFRVSYQTANHHLQYLQAASKISFVGRNNNGGKLYTAVSMESKYEDALTFNFDGQKMTYEKMCNYLSDSLKLASFKTRESLLESTRKDLMEGKDLDTTRWNKLAIFLYELSDMCNTVSKDERLSKVNFLDLFKPSAV